MNDAKQQIVERLKQANNVLVTVSSNPSVDQLSAAIGLALFLNKLGKHASAVFSGRVPSILEFLEPEKTLEKNTDSLRDFIIALDKSKADKLRYKVEDEHVKIFITPYRTSISQEDLQFSQGDFNVDVVVALGVQEQKDLDQAITAHGRILHDATVMSIAKVPGVPGANLGTINWVDATASSLCEMTEQVTDGLKANGLDSQMATAFLTGIVAETARFSNEKTTSNTMAVSSKLLAAGANQKLVAEKLTPKPVAPPPPPPPPPVQEQAQPSDQPGDQQASAAEPAPDQGFSLPPVQPAEPPKPEDGALYIDHGEFDDSSTDTEGEPQEDPVGQIHIDEQGQLMPIEEAAQNAPAAEQTEPEGRLMTEPPTLGGTLTASAEPVPAVNAEDPSVSGKPEGSLLGNDTAEFGIPPVSTEEPPSVDPFAEPVPPQVMTDPALPPEDVAAPASPGLFATEPPATEPQPDVPAQPDQTLTDLEQKVSSTHLEGGQRVIQPLAADDPSRPDVNAARSAVEQIANASQQPLPPISALNAQPVSLNLPGESPFGPPTAAPVQAEPTTSDFSFPDHLIQPSDQPQDQGPASPLPATPLPQPMSPAPPVPPPLMPGFAPGQPMSGVPFPPGPPQGPANPTGI